MSHNTHAHAASATGERVTTRAAATGRIRMAATLVPPRLQQPSEPEENEAGGDEDAGEAEVVPKRIAQLHRAHDGDERSDKLHEHAGRPHSDVFLPALFNVAHHFLPG